MNLSDNSFPPSERSVDQSQNVSSPVEVQKRWQDAVGEERKHLYHKEWRRLNLERKRLADERWRKNNKERIAQVCKRWHASHPDLVRNYKRKYAVVNKVKIAAAQKSRNEKFPEKRAASIRKYYETHKAECRERVKAFFEKNPHKQVVYTAARRARTLSVESECVDKHWKRIKESGKQKCFYCDKPVSDFHMDHLIPVSRGGAHMLHNIVVACPSCNQHKSDILPNEFIKKGQLVLL